MTVYKNLPNIITGLRILGTGCLLFTKPLSTWFYIVYALTGITDVLDGFIARKTGCTSELGARLDSIADILFYAVMLIRLFPIMWEILPLWIWIAVAVVLLIRLGAYLTAYIKYRRFASLHTYMNKLTGASIFVYPFVMLFPIAVPVAAVVCCIAGAASLEELLMHLCRAGYSTGAKTIFMMR
ncbi:MAG: CDP-alcohol phosphatidyltransferase family protein [Clostridia bacterium]|nr:CDP-alcohol phosphatidyltransferase family protein [Clostridia bacterium]